MVFKQRLITACIAIPVVWFIIFKLHPVSFSVVAMLFMLLAANEWAVLVGKTSWVFKVLLFLSILSTVFLAATFMWVACTVLLVSVVVWCWLAVAVLSYNKGSSSCGLDSYVLRTFMGWVVLTAGWLSLTVMKVHPTEGPIWLLYVCLLAWVVDSGAYCAGKLLGASPLAPRVSPKKTWEGFFGGMLSACILIVAANFFLPGISNHRLIFIGLSLFAAVASVFGDLSISLMKRIVGVKDTGSLFPGHGGVLDRIDSLLPVFLIFACSAVFFNLWGS